ncbi:growth/differentiation factor 10 [Megalops cyprinoides]|uniref:growth/differentiation factor 10 n=1 Tax=Megalops cyprinoides TaxID=118141 RepID=UPI00186450A3|nr:growth/differentiation factor 10 [Megalops cyprinoides]
MAASFVFLAHLFMCLITTDLWTAASEQTARSALEEDIESPVNQAPDSSAQDMVSIHMFKLYDKYNRELNRQRDGNTVRSFKGSPEIVDRKVMYRFNLTSIQESEVILAATFHFFFDKRPRQRSGFCKRFKNPSCRVQHLHQLPPLHLLFRSASSSVAHGPLLGNVTVFPHRRGTWQIKDVSQVIKGARNANKLLVTAEFDFGEKYQRYQDQLSPSSLPYMLVYANDLAISEPNSVAVTLQRYDPFPAGEEPTHSPNSSPDARVKRDTYFPDPIQNNELPEVEYNTFKNHELWESAYLALKPKTLKKDRRRKGQENSDGFSKSQILSFDEKTMKKARRRQWNEPRVCSRRYLKVDFADIGWSEWILSPKSFDAYYCAGTCEFPMPKVVRPSNHATIQSIVRAVGIVPGVPEPCCVPDKMNPLSVLFLDEDKNVVLKIYPSMSVESCACR